jgi:hypothetical protein
MSERFSAMRGMAAMAANMRSMARTVPCDCQIETNTFFHEPKKAPGVPSYTIGSSYVPKLGRREPALGEGKTEARGNADGRGFTGGRSLTFAAGLRPNPNGGGSDLSRGGGDEPPGGGEDVLAGGRLCRSSWGAMFERRGGRIEEAIEAEMEGSTPISHGRAID